MLLSSASIIAENNSQQTGRKISTSSAENEKITRKLSHSTLEKRVSFDQDVQEVKEEET